MSSGKPTRSPEATPPMLAAAILLPFVVAIAWLRLRHGVSFDLFILGSGSWGVGVVVKMVLYHAVVAKLDHERHLVRTSLVNGLCSGLSELGVALGAWVLLGERSLAEVVAFGVGIGAMEATLIAAPVDVFKGTRLQDAGDRLDAALSSLSGRSRFLWTQAAPVVERVIAGAAHVGTRGLAYIALQRTTAIPFLVALGVFVLADGVVGYRLLYRNRLTETRTLARFYAAFGALGFGSVAVFLAWWFRG